uniref:Uncharacterized protein n=1 Tax=Lotus japonicus TaxID=34305 RepID=I3SC44_LOTJA|nr:unknown [Lotus japonicus]
MSEMVAMSQSEVLKDMLDHTDGKGDIPVLGVPYDLLSRITSFCKKKHKFDNLFGEIAQLLKSTVDRHKAWVTGFVKSNHSIFSDLHQVACQLHIPNLLELTSRATKDMKGKTVEEISDWYSQMPREPIGEVEEISEWYSTLSISQMLSPLGIELEDSFLAG